MDNELINKFNNYCQNKEQNYNITNNEKIKLIQMILMLEKLKEGNKEKYEITIKRMGLEKLLKNNNITIFDAILTFYSASNTTTPSNNILPSTPNKTIPNLSNSNPLTPNNIIPNLSNNNTLNNNNNNNNPSTPNNTLNILNKSNNIIRNNSNDRIKQLPPNNIQQQILQQLKPPAQQQFDIYALILNKNWNDVCSILNEKPEGKNCFIF